LTGLASLIHLAGSSIQQPPFNNHNTHVLTAPQYVCVLVGAAAASQQSSHQQHLQQQVQELQQQLQKLQQQQQAPVRVCLQQQVQELQQQLQELQQALARVRLHGNRLQVTGLKSPGGGGGGWYHAPSGENCQYQQTRS